MRWKISLGLYLGVSLGSLAVADNSAPAIAASTAAVVASTQTLAAPVSSTSPVVTSVTSTSTVSNVVTSSVTVPVDHVENVTLRRFVGTIRSIDPAAYKLVLEDHDGKPSEFILTQRTRVTTDDGHRVNVSALKPGDRVTIRYVENYNYVRKIDILPALSK